MAPVVEIDVFQLHASFCTIFSSAVRLKIMDALGEEEKTVTELAEALDVPVANISQHLRVMRDLAAVTNRREGRTMYYRIANPKFLFGIRSVREGLLEELRKRGGM
ncbi:MAG: helix-turn-helix transcriptional regulator [Deltaproteobacteria bacterium]|nr:helix-turn-helix transcriptional regulator [Candidatus Anaeroferrophillacea bacterium]